MASEFHKILEKAMGHTEVKEASLGSFEEFYLSIENIARPQTRRSFQGSLYIEYQKDPVEIEKLRLQREKEIFCAFLSKIPSEKVKKAAEKFYQYGVRRYLSGQIQDLKKDFRTLAKELHPDRHALATEEKKLYFHREFRLLRESFEILEAEFTRRK